MIEKIMKLLPPETANSVSLWALKNGLGPKAEPQAPSINLFGKKLPNRIGLAGGADKNASALPGWRDMGLGFVEAGTLTLNPRAGNPKPRVWRMKDCQSLVNWMGLPNKGLEIFAANLASFRNSPNGREFCVGVSLASPDGIASEFSAMASRLKDDADFFTLNASCPNVTDHAASALRGLLEQFSETMRGAGGKPVLVKLGPTNNFDSLRLTVDAFTKAGAGGFIACNTAPYTSRDLLGVHKPDPWPQHDGQPVGGYSGPDLFPVSSKMAKTIREQIGPDLTVIGIGGIGSAGQAREMIANGADAIQLYTALTYQGPKLLKELRHALN